MPAALVFGVDEAVDDIRGKSRTDDAGTEADDVCIVMAAGKTRGECVADACGADSFVLVCGDAHADARAAYENAEVGFSRLNLAAELVRKFGIIDRFFCAVAADIGIFDAALAQMAEELCFEGIACVVAADCDFFVFHDIFLSGCINFNHAVDYRICADAVG